METLILNSAVLPFLRLILIPTQRCTRFYVFPIKKVFSWLGSPYYYYPVQWCRAWRSEVPIGSSKSLSHCSVLSDMKLLSFQFWAQQCTFDALLLWLDCPWPKEGRARRTKKKKCGIFLAIAVSLLFSHVQFLSSTAVSSLECWSLELQA